MSKSKNSQLVAACEKGNSNKVKSLLEDPEVDPACYNNTPVQKASEHGFLEIVQLLLKRQVNAADNDSRALRLAAANGHAAIVQLLLNLAHSKQVDAAAGDNEALIHAVAFRKIEVVRILLKSGRVDPSARENRAMRLACMQKNWDMVWALQSDPRADYEDGLSYAGLAAPTTCRQSLPSFAESSVPSAPAATADLCDEDPTNF